MGEFRQLTCPMCGANVPTQLGMARTVCEYCRSPLAVEMNHGEMVLHSTEKIAGTVREESERTRAALQRMELHQRRAHLLHDFNATRSQIDHLDAEIRTLQRTQKSWVVLRQLREVSSRRQETGHRLDWLIREIGQIDAVLNPHSSTLPALPKPPAPTFTLGRNQGCIMLVVAFFVLPFAIMALGYLSPLIILGTIILIVLAWYQPHIVEQLTQAPGLSRLPQGVRASPKRFAVIIAAVILPLALLFGLFTYGPNGAAYRTATPVPSRTATPIVE